MLFNAKFDITKKKVLTQNTDFQCLFDSVTKNLRSLEPSNDIVLNQYFLLLKLDIFT